MKSLSARELERMENKLDLHQRKETAPLQNEPFSMKMTFTAFVAGMGRSTWEKEIQP